VDDQELQELLDWLLDPHIVTDERLRTAIRARAHEWRQRHREPIALPRREGDRVALGIDVSASHGLDLVVLGDDLRPARIANVQLDSLARFIRDTAPAVIAIDSPPSWARAGSTRRAERGVSKLRISACGVPEEGLQTDFHAWMRVGFAVFEIAGRAGFSRYVSGPVARSALEVFPYASAVAFAGYRPRALSGARRIEWRRRVLAEAGVDTEVLRTSDQVDAGLAALTALRSLDGSCVTVGDPDEGVIVLPVPEIPAGGWPLRVA